MQDGQAATKVQTFKTWIGGQVGRCRRRASAIQSFNPYTAEPWAEIPECDATDVERAVEAAHKAFTSGPWPSMTQIGARQTAAPHRRTRREARRVSGADRDARQRQADLGDVASRPAFSSSGTITSVASPTRSPAPSCRSISRTTSPTRCASRSACARSSCRGTRRCCWSPTSSRRRWRPATPSSSSRASSLRPRRSNSAAWCSSPPACRRASSTSSPATARSSASRWSRIRRSPRSPSPAARRRARASTNSRRGRSRRSVARTRRQVAEHRVRRRRARRRRQRRRLRHLRRDRADVHRRLAPAAAGEHPRPVRRQAAGAGEDREARRPQQVRDPGRPGDDAAAVPEDPLLHRHRQGRGRQVRARRRRRRRRPKAAAPTSSSRPSSRASHNKMRIAQEEVFGPVLSVIPFKDEEHAVEIANDVIYGLGSGVWTQNVSRALRWRAASGRHGVGQHLPRRVAADAVRRLQGLGPRPRERRHRHRRIPAVPNRVWINLGGNAGNPFVMKTAAPS